MAVAGDAAHVWYFAIGSMMNPTSLKARGLVPLESFPAELLDFELMFIGKQGMAAAQAVPGKSFHGVLHLMSEKHMCVLDEIERGYVRQPAQARLYDGTPRECTVYTKSDAYQSSGSAVDMPPTERYRDILCEGAEHFGVKPHHVEWIQSQPFQPRKRPEELVKFEVPADLPVWTRADVDRGSAANGPPYYWEINGKVLKYVGPSEGLEFDFVKKIYAGNDVAFRMATNLYDPKHGLPASPAEVSQERRDEVEDYIATGMMKGLTEVVAVLEQ